MYLNGIYISISIFLDIANFANFRLKNADVNKTKLCLVIHIVFGSPLGKAFCPRPLPPQPSVSSTEKAHPK